MGQGVGTIVLTIELAGQSRSAGVSEHHEKNLLAAMEVAIAPPFGKGFGALRTAWLIAVSVQGPGGELRGLIGHSTAASRVQMVELRYQAPAPASFVGSALDRAPYPQG